MGYGAIIGAIGSVVGSAIGAVGSSGGAPKPQKVNLQTVSLTDPNSALGQYAYQGVQLPGVEQTANQADVLSNQAYQRMLAESDPNLVNQIGQISNLASSYLSGIIPQDVQDQIQRATAQQSLQGGYGGTQMARNLTARDLGLTSINLQKEGVGMAGTAAGMARAINPSFTPISSLLFTPSQLLARTDQANYYNTDVKNQQNIINSGQMAAAQAAGAAQKKSQTAGLQGLVSSLFGSGSGGGGGGVSSGSGGLLGGIMSLFGGGGGGGGGGGVVDTSGLAEGTIFGY